MTAIQTQNPALNAPTVRKFPNGLTVVAEQMPVDAVNLNVWLNVGSALESDSINGMAHFLEHMVFKGTPRLEIGEFERLIEERGARTNAATSQEYTHYYITTAPQDFATLAPLQMDVVLNPSINDEAFERERFVVLEEIRRSEDSPSRRTFYRAMETCFERLPYRRPVLGPADVIERLVPQQMRDFHAQWYQPTSMTAAVVGNLPAEELIGIVSEAFEELHQPKANVASVSPFAQTLNSEPAFPEIVRREYEDSQLQQARLVMMWRVPGMGQLEETYALDVLAAILSGGKMSRLFRDLREERKLVTSIGVSNMTKGLQGAFYISARLQAENLAVVEQAIIEHIRRCQEELVDSSEIKRIRTQVANRFIFGNERPSSRANLYGYYHSQLGDLEPAFTYPTRIQSVEATDVQAAARRYLSPEAYGVVILRPTTRS
ncbi:M16 family metallopeptidase [Lusitaniella coriacea]|uniref:M16 family metallopeptidase n=1 Tax=Lusitaniella coriacea TaxID=1983105 RepID=UPI003CF5EC00